MHNHYQYTLLLLGLFFCTESFGMNPAAPCRSQKKQPNMRLVVGKTQLQSDILKFILYACDDQSRGRFGATSQASMNCYRDIIVCKVPHNNECSSFGCKIFAANFDKCTKALAFYATCYKKDQKESDKIMFGHLWNYHKTERCQAVATITGIQHSCIEDCLEIYAGNCYFDKSEVKKMESERLYNFLQSKGTAAAKTMLLSNQVFDIEGTNSAVLTRACRVGDMNIIEELYKKQSKYTVFSEYISDVIRLAIEHGNEKLVFPLIAKYREISEREKFKLYKCALRCDNYIVEILESLFLNDIHATDEDGASLMHMVTPYDNKNIMQYLLDNGAKLDVTDKKGRTIFDYISYGGVDWQRIDDTIRFFLKNGADINRVDQLGKTVLMRSVHGSQDLAPSLIKCGAKVDTVDNDGKTALHHYANDCKDKYGVAEKLIEKGVEVDRIDNKGRTALHYACKCGNSKTAKKLLQSKARVDIRDEEGNTVIDIVKGWSAEEYKKYEELIPSFLENGFGSYFDISELLMKKFEPRQGWSDSKSEEISSWIESGAKIDTVDKDGKTVLHHCAQFFKEIPHIRAYPKIPAIIEKLISKGIDVNAVDKKGRTALHCACRYAHSIEIAEILLQRGADIDICDGNGDGVLSITANECYAHTIGSYMTMIIFLLKKRANPRVVNKEKRGLLHVLCESIKDSHLWGYEDALISLMSKGIDIHAIDNNGNTALSIATKNNNKPLISLLKYGTTNKGKICTKIAAAGPVIVGVTIVAGCIFLGRLLDYYFSQSVHESV